MVSELTVTGAPAVAACFTGKTPMQIQERFQKLITDISLIHKSYINLHHTSIAPTAPPTTLERNPLSLPGTSKQNQPSNTYIIQHQPLTKTGERKKTVHWTQQENEYVLFYSFFLLFYLLLYEHNNIFWTWKQKK
ncbi:hypothetical protein S245_028091 [Arachis hypogaea]